MSEENANKGDVNSLGCGVMILLTALTCLGYVVMRDPDRRMDVLDEKVEATEQRLKEGGK